MAKPFSFKLEKVLDYRTQLEEQAKGALAKAKAVRDVQREKVDDLHARMQAHMAKETESRKSANDMWLWRQYREALVQDTIREEGVLHKLELKLQKCRQEAVERSRDKKLLEKLKETQAKKFHKEERAREEKENDEMAAIRYESQDI